MRRTRFDLRRSPPTRKSRLGEAAHANLRTGHKSLRGGGRGSLRCQSACDSERVAPRPFNSSRAARASCIFRRTTFPVPTQLASFTNSTTLATFSSKRFASARISLRVLDSRCWRSPLARSSCALFQRMTFGGLLLHGRARRGCGAVGDQVGSLARFGVRSERARSISEFGNRGAARCDSLEPPGTRPSTVSWPHYIVKFNRALTRRLLEHKPSAVVMRGRQHMQFFTRNSRARHCQRRSSSGACRTHLIDIQRLQCRASSIFSDSACAPKCRKSAAIDARPISTRMRSTEQPARCAPRNSRLRRQCGNAVVLRPRFAAVFGPLITHSLGPPSASVIATMDRFSRRNCLHTGCAPSSELAAR